jgi:hypothetical protein
MNNKNLLSHFVSTAKHRYALFTTAELETELTHKRNLAVRYALRGEKDSISYAWAIEALHLIEAELKVRRAYAKRQENRTAAL